MNPYYIGGAYQIQEALQQGRVQKVFVQNNKKSKKSEEIIAFAQKLGVAVEYVPQHHLEMMVPDVRHRGLAALCQVAQPKTWKEALHGRAAPLILILDSIQDPHNLGACLRSAAAADVDAVLIPNHDACELTPAARQVSCGGSEIVPVFSVSNLHQEIEKMKKMGIWIVSATGESASSLYACDFKLPMAIILGNEGDGIHRGLLESSDFRAAIPMQNGMESLNVSVACGIFLFEALRQRHHSS